MTDEELVKKVREVLHEEVIAGRKKGAFPDIVVRAGVTLTTGLMVFGCSLLWSMNNTLTRFTVELQGHDRMILKHEEMLTSPRFTQDMFDRQTRELFDNVRETKKKVEILSDQCTRCQELRSFKGIKE